MHIGLFGGSFNPIHSCHLRIAEQVQTEVKLDQVIFIPTGDPPHKASTSLSPWNRIVWPWSNPPCKATPPLHTSDMEIRASRISYTIDTVRLLKGTRPEDTEWSFLIGLDAFLDFPSWKQANDLLGLCHFVVCSRPGSNFSSLHTIPGLPAIPLPDLAGLDAGYTHRLDLTLPTSTHLTLLALQPCKASASTIRKFLKHGRSVSQWLPASVESYIMKHRLYQCDLQ